MMHKATSLMAAAGVLTVSMSLAVAQPKGAEKPMAPAAAAAVVFSDADMTAVVNALTGSWKGSIPGASGTAPTEIVMSVAPVRIKECPDSMYVELARADSLVHPFRQAIWQLHRVGGKLRLKTMEFRRPRGALESAAGTWAIPEAFPAVNLEDLVATLDLDLTKAGNQWKGQTPHSYPTSVGGAVEMVSEITFGGDTFATADRGMDANGKPVWGPASDAGYPFHKFDAGVKASKRDGGLIVIDYPSETKGDAVKAGDKVLVQYSMYLEDGRLVDSSYERSEPWPYYVGRNYGRAVEGWKQAVADTRKGTIRRVSIPGSLGIPGGDVAAKVPVNATLYVDVQIVDVVAGGGAAFMAQPAQAKFEPVKPGDPGTPDLKKMEAEMQKKLAERQAKEAQQHQPAPAPAPK